MNYNEQFEENREQILNDYFTFLRFASIATDPAFTSEVLKCADWVCTYLKNSPFQVEKWETGRAPVIFAQDLRAGPDKNTILFYCHYDVQPVDPLNEWITPPFEPTIREAEVYARGAADNKGQCFYTMLALTTVLNQMEKPPVNVKFIIEGEEESGSCGLSHLLKEKKQALSADHLVIVDSGIENLQRPAITLGARGIISMEVTLTEAAFDLHSGSLGGAAYNPNRALAQLINTFYDQHGRVAIPGFYDNITPISLQDKQELSVDFNESEFEKLFGFLPLGMEKGVDPKEAIWLRPTLEVNGIWGGYTGAGFKTVIPSQAHAKISCRLVPHQDPEKVIANIKEHILTHLPSSMKSDVNVYPGNSRGFRTSPDAPIVKLMAQCYTDVFEKPCQKLLIGGSIPIAVDLCETAEAEMVLVGLGLPDDHIHAPNEHFGLYRLEKGYQTICHTIELFDTMLHDVLNGSFYEN
jgi:acetylornithine deacetylase/succinyl-diaminopimelate desuccinylase-like protein